MALGTRESYFQRSRLYEIAKEDNSRSAFVRHVMAIQGREKSDSAVRLIGTYLNRHISDPVPPSFPSGEIHACALPPHLPITHSLTPTLSYTATHLSAGSAMSNQTSLLALAYSEARHPQNHRYPFDLPKISKR